MLIANRKLRLKETNGRSGYNKIGDTIMEEITKAQAKIRKIIDELMKRQGFKKPAFGFKAGMTKEATQYAKKHDALTKKILEDL